MFNDHHIFLNNIYDNAFNLLKLQKLNEDNTTSSTNVGASNNKRSASLDDGVAPRPSGWGQIGDATWEIITNIPDPTSPWFGYEKPAGSPFPQWPAEGGPSPAEWDPYNPSNAPQGPMIPKPGENRPPDFNPNYHYEWPQGSGTWYYLPNGYYPNWWMDIPEGGPSSPSPGLPGQIPGSPYYPGVYQS